MTQTGLSLGTPHYMAPEQATGERGVDARADVYALGAVVYEMLSGEPPFTGPSTPAVLSRVLTERPRSIRSSRPQVPEHVEATLEVALEKLPADRFATAKEFSEALTGARAVALPSGRARAAAATTAGGKSWSKGITRGALAGWGTALVTTVGLIAAIAVRPPAPSAPVARFDISPGPGHTIGSRGISDTDFAISGDGQRIVYVATDTLGQELLLMRQLDQLAATSVGRGGPARMPFFSGDGEWIGYFEGTELKKVLTGGGQDVTILRALVGGPRGASWGPDDLIIFATATQTTGLLRVSAAGGEPEVLTTPNAQSGEQDHVYPDVLPDGNAVIFTITSSIEGRQIAVLDLATKEQKILVQGGTNARYASSGHLVYVSEGTLFAVPFDARRLEVRGNPVPVVEGILMKGGGVPNYAFSQSGHLVYAPGNPLSAKRSLVWVDRNGGEEAIDAPPRAYVYPRISPDGSRLAISVLDQDLDVWIWDFARRALTRLTFDPAYEGDPVWTADGREIVFSSQRSGRSNLYRQNADGGGTAERLTESPHSQSASSATPDGSGVVFQQLDPAGWDVVRLSLDGQGEADPVLASEFSELHAEISPDGNWIAYQSNESSRQEVYVRPFPNTESAGQSPVSIDGGTRPLWARNGRELFFLDPVGRLMTVPVQVASGSFTAGTPSRVLDRAYVNANNARTYDVSPDGQRFLMVKATGGDTAEPLMSLVLVLNWFEELKRLAPGP